MRNLLRCRRGSAAFATVIALVPLIGVVALGAEGGSWYVTKQHAQNAADAAAYSGALRLACSLAAHAGVACTDASSVDYRGKEFAAQNAFCNADDTSSYPGSQCLASLPTGISQAVQITVNGNLVQATVSQQQPAYLAKVLGLSTVTIGATATAEVVVLSNPCVLSLQDPISFKGSPTVNGPNCGLASNSTAANAVDFTGNGGINVSVKSISEEGSCAETGGSQCSQTTTYASPVPNPLSGLDSAMSSLGTGNFSGQCSSPPQAYGSGNTCYNKTVTFGNQTYNLNGVYFFSGALRIQGNATIAGTATLILLPGASLTITGNPTIQINALASVPATQVPAALASVVNLLSGLLIYDPETSSSVNITGGSTSYFNGITYIPNSDVTYQGSTQSYGCVEVIAKGVTLSGNSNFDNSGCPASVRAQSQYVRLVQ